MTFTSYGLGLAWKNYGEGKFNVRKAVWIPVVLMLIAPFIFANKLRFDRFQPIPYYRPVAAEMNDLLSTGDKLTVINPQGSGESGVITRYERGEQGFFGLILAPSKTQHRTISSATYRQGITLMPSFTP